MFYFPQRLQDSELRNHELSDSITESTRPLLRQMENLQATHSAQAKTWEALEKSLTSRLSKTTYFVFLCSELDAVFLGLLSTQT